jgi:hypothetical protein
MFRVKYLVQFLHSLTDLITEFTSQTWNATTLEKREKTTVSLPEFTWPLALSVT